MKTPHKHAEIIHAWAEGTEIQVSMNGGHWSDCRPTPEFNVNCDYRIKPEPKPDVVIHGYLYKDSWGTVLNTNGMFTINIKLTFDGETGQLKLAEVIS